MFWSACRGSAWWLAWVGVLSLLAPPLLGQSTGGRIIGRVADPTGAVLADVQVTLTNQATSVSRQAQTNGSGDYTFVEVVPGTYRVELEHAGFKKNSQGGVIVDVNQVVTLNSVLQLGEVQDVVEVTSEAPQVDTTSTQLGAVINDRSVNELPLNARDTYQFLQLQPGVQAQLGSSGSLFFGSDDAGSVSVNGGRTPDQQLQRKRRRCQRSIREYANHTADSGQRGGIPGYHQYLRRGIWEKFRVGRKRDYEVWEQCSARRFIRILPEHRTECAGLFQLGKAAIQPESIRRNSGRSDQKGSHVLLCFV